MRGLALTEQRYSWSLPSLTAFRVWMREVRIHAEVTQDELAKSTGISRRMIQAIEHGQSDLSLTNAGLITRYLRKKKMLAAVRRQRVENQARDLLGIPHPPRTGQPRS